MVTGNKNDDEEADEKLLKQNAEQPVPQQKGLPHHDKYHYDHADYDDELDRLSGEA